MAEKKKAPRSAFKPGQSGNPKGRPKDEESWSGVLRFVKNATAEELAEMVGGKSTDLGRAFLQMPKGIQLKYLMALRAAAGFMFEPTSTLWNTMMERDEGKVTSKLDMTTDGSLTVVVKRASDADESAGQ